MASTLTFERRFNAGFYPILDGEVIGRNGIGRETPEAAEGEYFASYAWPGGYPIEYVTAAGDILCGGCAQTEFRETGRIAEAFIVEESDHDVTCDECSTVIHEQNLCPDHGAAATDHRDGFRCLICDPRAGDDADD